MFPPLSRRSRAVLPLILAAFVTPLLAKLLLWLWASYRRKTSRPQKRLLAGTDSAPLPTTAGWREAAQQGKNVMLTSEDAEEDESKLVFYTPHSSPTLDGQAGLMDVEELCLGERGAANAGAGDEGGPSDPFPFMQRVRVVHRQGEAVRVGAFNEAFREMIAISNQFGTAFGFVGKQLEGFVTKLEASASAHAKRESVNTGHLTLADLIKAEAAQGIGRKDKNGALYQLVRMVHFFEFVKVQYENLANPAQFPTLQSVMEDAYARTLKAHDSWVEQKVVGAAFRWLPSREGFLQIVKLPNRSPDEVTRIMAEMHRMLVDIQCRLWQLVNADKAG